jgi:hypothetical protein
MKETNTYLLLKKYLKDHHDILPIDCFIEVKIKNKGVVDKAQKNYHQKLMTGQVLTRLIGNDGLPDFIFTHYANVVLALYDEQKKTWEFKTQRPIDNDIDVC